MEEKHLFAHDRLGTDTEYSDTVTSGALNFNNLFKPRSPAGADLD